MRWSFAIVSVLILCLFSMFALFFFEEVTISNEQDYYLLKENIEAAMFDAIDIAYYRDSGEIKMSKEKFIENFVRRFSENAKLGGYIIEGYDINEEPPKATIRVTNSTRSYNIYTGMGGNQTKNEPTSVNIVNEVSGILETNECYMKKRLLSVAANFSKDKNYAYNQMVNKGAHVKYEEKLRDFKGYTAVQANYISSWRQYVLNTNNQGDTLDTLWAQYRAMFSEMYDYSGGVTVGAVDSIDYFANIYMSKFKIESKNGVTNLVYDADYICPKLGEGTSAEGTQVWICQLGIIYEILYKKDNDYCRNR